MRQRLVPQTERLVSQTENRPQESSTATPGTSWPKAMGEYVATSGESVPPFPSTLTGYRSSEGEDFWGKPYPRPVPLRVFQGEGWQGLQDFPNTMNGCSAGVFMIRWRLSDPNVRVESSVRSGPDDTTANSKAGVFGYMVGSNCEQPMFRFAAATDGSTLVDVYYEIKFWQAAP